LSILNQLSVSLRCQYVVPQTFKVLLARENFAPPIKDSNRGQRSFLRVQFRDLIHHSDAKNAP